jgi:hypothetical protein
MQLLIVMYLIFTPLTFASIFPTGARIEFSLLFASLIALAWVLSFLSGRVGIRRADRWSIWFWLFIAFSIVSLTVSPYSEESYTKGIEQIAGIAAVLSASLYISRHIAVYPSRLSPYVKVLVMIIALVAGIGLWQSLASNVLQLSFLTNFSFLNGLLQSVLPENFSFLYSPGI